MDFTIHQYLLATEPSILFATGTVQQAERSLPEIEEILGGRPLDYIFVSHMESDEYGGIRIFPGEISRCEGHMLETGLQGTARVGGGVRLRGR